MQSTWHHWLCLATVVALFSGCVPYADQPLTDPGESVIDAALLGTWFWNEDSENGFVHIGTNAKGDRLRLLMVTRYRDGELDVAEFAGHASTIGGNTYLNLKAVGSVPGVPDGYFFMKVMPSAESLGIALMAHEVVERAIADGTLAGNVGEPGNPSSVHITDRPARLREFLIRHDKSLYAQVKQLPRLRLPDPSPSPAVQPKTTP